VSDEQEGFKPEADEDVEAHRGTLGLPAQDEHENESDEASDDVEAHRKHGGA
jgi:hypothetical protein